ncbi:unnamed protein product [Pseudo-nitzschia multistriata]|uniref:Uncharacterized protein n=1 Tax=Pseudo-nitzschia multistriata TaxID=183589 RepID=A0A448ZTB8_9STRA|nr:unnamed protein product [Pseudo-nitzschia multistriata]
MNTMNLSFVAILSVIALQSTQAMISPAVSCCEDNGGKYEIVDGSDGQSGVCRKDGVNTEAFYFMDQNCPPPPTVSPSNAPTMKYSVYAVNNCDATVTANFVLRSSRRLGGNRNSQVEVQQGQCTYVGPTNLDVVTYTSQGSYVSSGNDSCLNIGDSNNSDCNLLGIAENACVVNLC